MTDVEILKTLTGGGAVCAVIAVVMLFLRQQALATDAVKEITAKFMLDVRDGQKSFQDQLRDIMSQTNLNQKLYQDQIKGLIDDHMTVTRETVSAVKSLDATVRAVESTVRSVETTVRELQSQVRYDRRDDRLQLMPNIKEVTVRSAVDP